jgi:hypothetical protein
MSHLMTLETEARSQTERISGRTREISLGILRSLIFVSTRPSSRLSIISRCPLAYLLLTSRSKTRDTSPYGRSADLETEDRCLYKWRNAVAQKQQV